MPDSAKIVLAGGSGFLGRALCSWYHQRGAEVVVLSRQPGGDPETRTVAWDARTLGMWAEELEGASALINLAGRSVNCRQTAANKQAMMDSRVLSTRVLGEAVAQCSAPPPVWLNASTATVYKHTFGEAHGEEGEIGATAEAKDAFSIEIATAWEAVFAAAATPGVRKVVLRMAVVLGNEAGSAYDLLRGLVRRGLGGRVGSGKQYVSWLHEEDYCRAVQWLIENPAAEGVYNLSAPEQVTNQEMMAVLRRQLGMPIGLPATRWMLEIGTFLMRTESELVIKSRRVAPKRLLAEGFTFTHPSFEGAIKHLEATR